MRAVFTILKMGGGGKIATLWNTYGFMLMIIGSIIVIIVLACTVKTEDKRRLGQIDWSPTPIVPAANISEEPVKKRSPAKYTTEGECRRVVEQIFSRDFPKIRPDWLKNPKTGRNLECDMFNSDLNLCVEFSGAQHYSHQPHFHQTEAQFVDQQERDAFKQQKCTERGVKLVVVPYLVHRESLGFWLCDRLSRDPQLASHISAEFCSPILAAGDPSDQLASGINRF